MARLVLYAGIRNKHRNNRKHMKLYKILLAIVAAASVGLLSSAQATPITGMLNIGGTATFDTTSLATAHSATFSDAIVLGGNSGDFASFAVGTPVVMASYTFDPSTITNGLWSVNGFTFNLTASLVQLPRSATFLSITGTGTITGPPGFDPTPGIWAFTSQNAGGRPHSTFSFSANTEAVPDGGMTMALLGTGLMGLAAFRAKFAKS
jgi:VPDSG-CTERM motif